MQVEHTQFFGMLNANTEHILFKTASLAEKI